jgi:hypothetical protein
MSQSCKYLQKFNKLKNKEVHCVFMETGKGTVTVQ